MLTIKQGDLFLTKRNQHDRPPVVGFFERVEGLKSINSVGPATIYFTAIEEGTIGIYCRKKREASKYRQWARFHEVWIGGRLCILHEDYIGPLPKAKE